MSGSMGAKGFRKLTAIGLVSVSIIAFQLVMMMQFSIAQWHHFAQLVIATALLGFGAAGTLLSLFRRWMAEHYERLFPALLLACGLGMALSGHMAGIVGDFDALLLFLDREQWLRFAVFCVAYILPFLFGGLAVTLAFYCEVGQIGRLYFSNMAGSGLGALMIVLLMSVVPISLLPGMLALIPVVAGLLCIRFKPAELIVSGAVVIAIALAVFRPAEIPVSQFKSIERAMLLPGAEIIERSQSPYGLIEVVRSDVQRYAPALSLRYTGSPPVRDVMFLNGDYFGTLPARPVDGKPDILDFTTRALPYIMVEPGNVLLVHAATGSNAAHALARGSKNVTALESNRDAIKLLTKTNPSLNDSLYFDDRIRPETANIRGYLHRPGEGYDIIVLPVLDGFGGSAGVYAMHEQYHLTMEAFSAMWGRLNPNGLIAVTTWQDYPLRYALKVPLAFRSLLEAMDVERPEHHIAALRGWGTITYVVGKSPVTDAQSERIRAFATEMGFDPLWLPDIREDERGFFNSTDDPALLDHTRDIITGNYRELIGGYIFHLRPATDNKPFFSHFLKWRSLPEIRDMAGGGTLPYMEAGFILAIAAFVLVLVISLLMIVLPLLQKGWEKGGRFRTLMYFTGTGLGFIMFEMVLIQQLTLYLGLPVFATALVLAALLIGSAIGSYFSARLKARPSIIKKLALTVIVCILLCMAIVPLLISHTMSWAFILRLMVAGALLLMPAFFMGMMFPLGLRHLSGQKESHIPWACAIDSFFSVTAAAMTILIALHFGLMAVMALAACAYLLPAFAFGKG